MRIRLLFSFVCHNYFINISIYKVYVLWIPFIAFFKKIYPLRGISFQSFSFQRNEIATSLRIKSPYGLIIPSVGGFFLQPVDCYSSGRKGILLIRSFTFIECYPFLTVTSSSLYPIFHSFINSFF